MFKGMISRKVKITFIEELLGTKAADSEIHSKFIASKAPDAKSREEEIADHGVEEITEKSMTVFMRDENGNPYIYDYQLKGYFKSCCGYLRRIPGTESHKITAYKKVIDGLIFVMPRKIFLILPEGYSEKHICQRPLRGETAQGSRIALASSETVPEGTQMIVDILYHKAMKNVEKLLDEWLDYGELHGTGQWRNSGKGRFVWEKLRAK